MRSIIVRVAELCLFLLIGSGAARAEQGLFFEDGKGGAPAPVLRTSVEIRVTGVIARARVTQIFENPSPDWVEAVYLFPLPEDGAVDTLKMKIGERTVIGEIQETTEAKATYEQAKAEGQRASLLEQRRPDVFTMSVANIGPGETVEIVIESQQVVRWGAGRFRLRFPTVVAPRFSPPRDVQREEDQPLPAVPISAAGLPLNPLSFHVDLAPGFPLGSVTSPSHEVAVARGGGNRYAIDLAQGVVPADADLILEWVPAVGKEPWAVFASEEVDGDRYDLLMVLPPDAPEVAPTRLARETIFVVDNSFSMAGEPIEQARRALVLGLSRLQPGDWFNIVEFHDTTKTLFPAPVPADLQSLEEARRYAASLPLGPGTVMLPALQTAFRQTGQEGLVRQVIFVTDGQADNEAELLRTISEEIGDRRLFTVAIGLAPNASFLRKAAEIGGGSFTHIESLSGVEQRMGELFVQLDAPMLQDIEVRWADPRAEIWPSRIPDLYLGEPVVVVARGQRTGPVEISGRRGTERWQERFPAAADVPGAGIDKLWARRKIEALSDAVLFPVVTQELWDFAHQTIVDLGLRHHLMTPYTTLVAVDGVSEAPAGASPVLRVLPLPAPRATPVLFGANGVSESLAVSEENPLLDERKIALASTVSPLELEKLPNSRDPWAILRSTPGVLTEKLGVGNNETGQPGVVVGREGLPDQTSWALDGVVITALSALSPCPSYYDFDSFEEMKVTTGGADAGLQTPGVLVDVTTKRGTNELRGSAHLLWGDGSSQDLGLQKVRTGNAELGGPLVINHLWAWGSFAHDATESIAFGGQSQKSTLENHSVKLNSQLDDSTSASLFWKRGDISFEGLGASPARAPETTWERDGRDEIRKIEATRIFSSQHFLTVQAASVQQGQDDAPLGDRLGFATIDDAGVAHGAGFGFAEKNRARSGGLFWSSYFNTGSISHEVKAEISQRDEEVSFHLTGPERILVTREVAEVWRGGTARARLETTSSWLQDIATWRNATVTLGLRFDQQDLGIAGGPSPRTLSPRLGVNWGLGAERKTLLKASLSRFASRLGSGPAFRVETDGPATAYFLASVEGDLPWYEAGPRWNEIDPGLSPEITNELALGIEHAPVSELLVGLQGTWRRTSDVLEERTLVRDGEGRIFEATSDDWVPLSGWDGVFDLRPGLVFAGGTRLVNGDREQDYRGISLYWIRRLSNGWMSRGHASWTEKTWRVGPDFLQYDDPTRALGGGDRDGDPVAVPAAPFDRPFGSDRFLQSGWSFHADALYSFPWLSAAVAVNGREAYPTAWYRQVVRERAGFSRVPEAGPASLHEKDVITVDARLEKEFEFGYVGGLVVGLDVFNLLDSRTPLWREADLGTARAGLANDAVAPRAYRLDVRVTWR